MEGWIKIHQKLISWEWFDVPEMVALWIHILLCANWEDKEWHGITVPRGSFITSRKRLSEVSGLSIQQVRTCLSRMVDTKEITIKSTNKYTMITVCKYDCYQLRKDDEQPAQQQTNNKQITTTKEYKNNNITQQNAPAREETWRFISSVRRSVLGNNPDNIAEFKKELFRREVEANVSAAGMNTEQKEKFIGWWTEHTPGSEKIRAEYEAVFNTLDRMKIWMDRNQPKAAQAAKGRMDQLEEDLNFISNFFNGKQSSTTAPDEQ